MNDNSTPLSRIPQRALACLLLVFANHLHAQEANDVPPTADIATLESVQALPYEEEVLDLTRPKNPVTVEPNAFGKAYNPGISPEEMALQHGGYLNYGINLGLYKSWQGIKKITGMRAETQSAIARPPPLTEDQIQRAEKVCVEGGNGCGAEK